MQEIKQEPEDQELQKPNILPGASITDINILDEKEDIGNIKVEENNTEIKECIKKVDNDANQLDRNDLNLQEAEINIPVKLTIVKGNSKLNNKFNANPKKKKVVKRASDGKRKRKRKQKNEGEEKKKNGKNEQKNGKAKTKKRERKTIRSTDRCM